MAVAKKVAKKKAAVPPAQFSDTDTTTEAPKAKKRKVAKKAPASKTTAKKAPATKKATKKTAAKKSTAAPAKKKAGASKRKGSTDGRTLPRELNDHGFVVGSNSEQIVNEMLAGGESRAEIADRVAKKVKGRDGQPVNANALMSGLLHRMLPKGYTIEQTWRLVPPTPQSKAAATRAAKKAGKAGK